MIWATRERVGLGARPRRPRPGRGAGLAYREALLGRGGADFGVDGVEFGDAAQCFGHRWSAALPTHSACVERCNSTPDQAYICD